MLLCGGACVGAGTAGTRARPLFAGDAVSRIEVPKPALRVAMIDRLNDVSINKIAETVVAFDSKVADPRGPNAVCDPIPPNAPARSAAFPLCSNTTIIRKIQTIT